jgi:hypothetical protein
MNDKESFELAYRAAWESAYRAISDAPVELRNSFRAHMEMGMESYKALRRASLPRDLSADDEARDETKWVPHPDDRVHGYRITVIGDDGHPQLAADYSAGWHHVGSDATPRLGTECERVEASVSLPGFGPATTCEVLSPGSHRPVPLRFVWHHVQPKEAGGLTVAVNLVQVCDGCHYSVHRIMWHLARSLPPPAPLNRAQNGLARHGFDACVAAGTVARIPNEG